MANSSQWPSKWLQKFFTQPGSEFYCCCRPSWIEEECRHALHRNNDDSDDEGDKFCAEVILGRRDSSSASGFSDEQNNEIQEFYIQLHQQYVASPPGLYDVKSKYSQGVYGKCPRLICQKQHLIPMQLSKDEDQKGIAMYCVRCNEIFLPSYLRHARLDGRAFGLSFAALFFIQYPELIPNQKTYLYNDYAPRVFGFRMKGLTHQNRFEFIR
ncbi:MAG: putative Casein kinase II, regulatory subunit [Streblomastix strix]|uniref:Casein kinase II subunit beta n=1 Tax=Streblomastix strix TaxID=222440 RepID=A0A5J4X3F6_9EUKA|nr:MAG: putative Casein kinase II, regulatory subunit [Streblomastix strix]